MLKIINGEVVNQADDYAKQSDLNNVTTQLSHIEQKQDKFTEDTNGKLLYNNAKVGATKASELTLDAISGMVAKDVQAGIAEAFQFASNGKTTVGGAVTGVTGLVTTNNTFQQLADKINLCQYPMSATGTYRISVPSGASIYNTAGGVIKIPIPQNMEVQSLKVSVPDDYVWGNNSVYFLVGSSNTDGYIYNGGSVLGTVSTVVMLGELGYGGSVSVSFTNGFMNVSTDIANYLSGSRYFGFKFSVWGKYKKM